MARAPFPARKPRKPPAEPTESLLHDAALTYLSRYGATQAGVVRVLDRKIARWAAAEPEAADRAAAAKATARAIVARLAATGAVNDAAFATSRAKSLQRAGKSGRAIGAHLAARGVTQELAKDTVTGDADQELAAAVIHARKRRLGPFRKLAETPDLRRKELGNMARAGFAHGIARQALNLTADEAEALIIAFRASL
jgi:regulatory protein